MAEHFMGYMCPLHFVSKLFAVSQLNPSKKLSIISVVYSLLLVVFMNFLSAYQLVSEITDEDKSKLFKFVAFICTLSPTITRTAICIVYILKHKILLHFLDCISHVESVTWKGLKVKLPKGVYVRFQFLILFVIGIAVGVHAIFRFSIDGFVPGVLKMFAVITYLSQAQFISCVLLLNQYINVVTQSLNRLTLLVRKDQVIHTCKELIRFLSVMKEDLNSFFSIPILLVVANNMLLTTFNLYMLIKQWSVSPHLDGGVRQMHYLYTVLMNIVQVMFIAFSCAAVRDEIQTVAALIHELLNTKQHQGTVALVAFSKQILHIDMTFTACGFFTLNESLITSVFAAISTQLVILLQFQMSPNSQEIG